MDIAVLGYGVVGSGVAEVISLNEQKITKKIGGEKMNVKYILDLRKFPGDKNEDKIIDDSMLFLTTAMLKLSQRPWADFTRPLNSFHPA